MKTLLMFIKRIRKTDSPQLKNWISKTEYTKLGQLYSGLASGLFKTDLDASKALYGEAGGNSYHRLKSSLKDKLIELACCAPIEKVENDNIECVRELYILSLIWISDVEICVKQEYLKSVRGKIERAGFDDLLEFVNRQYESESIV